MATALRDEIHDYVNELPDTRLKVIKSFMSILSDGEPLIIENDLTDEEEEIVREGVNEFRERPERYVPLEDIIRQEAREDYA